MTLKQLIAATKPIKIIGDTDIEVTGIEIDSRQIKAGNVFIAMRGTQADGHNYILTKKII